LADVLLTLEHELRRLQLWEQCSPSEAALASTLPFCIDTLALHQWLQFVLLPKLLRALDGLEALPTACNIAPVAEQVYSQSLQSKKHLLAILKRLDSTLTLS
jgi:uncharacterized protein YqcC (DUF446 family)